MIFVLKYEKNIINVFTTIFEFKLDWTTFQPSTFMIYLLKINLLILVPKESPSLHSQFNLFVINTIEKKTRWFNRKNKSKMAFKHSFYFLSLFKNHVNTNANCLIQRNVCKQRLNVKRCHKTGPWRKGGVGEQNIFFHVKSVNITFLPVHNMKGFSLYIEQDLSDKK